ncbi:hypothetical protein [Atlantibacter hermannii]|uniref:hypothetical protein n=1 Tax=Atlantibacter hermannii TaxID=565 RepID=UPI0028A5C9C6|nr:hypothetical protein [Atlantibacter hermannii]
MASPLPGADYLRPPVKCGTREEVLARMKEIIDGFSSQQESESRDARMERHEQRRYEAAIWLMNQQAATFPRYEITGPRLPSRVNDRVWYGRYGHVRQD